MCFSTKKLGKIIFVKIFAKDSRHFDSQYRNLCIKIIIILGHKKVATFCRKLVKIAQKIILYKDW
jgi:hypothetical protein